MAGLSRSEVSFRRSGSSGLVWDDRVLSGELNKIQKQSPEQQQQQQQQKSINNKKNNNLKELQMSHSTGSGRGYRTGKVSPAIEPPSPKLSACGLCTSFGKKGQRSKPGKR